MKKFIVLLSLSFLAMPALAAAAQQEKMKTCNADADKQSLKADTRKTFMKECLSASQGTAVAPKKEMTPQQARMKKCNADAKTRELKGDARKKFMGECLKAG